MTCVRLFSTEIDPVKLLIVNVFSGSLAARQPENTPQKTTNNSLVRKCLHVKGAWFLTWVYTVRHGIKVFVFSMYFYKLESLVI